MEITYLIGNGFDIACGLNTRYADFIEYYISCPNSSDIIAEFKSYISSDIETWANAESALGEITQKYTDRSSVFQSCYDDFIFHLSSYLEKQQRFFNEASIANIGTKKFSRGVSEFYSSFPADEKESMIEWIKHYANNLLDINFLIFNYTDIFERVVNYAVDSENDFSLVNSKVYNGTYYAKLKEVEYVHGSIDNLPLILGVNDDSQIFDSILCNDEDVASTLVKPISNASIRKSVMERCRKIIDRSDIICIYGMSIGVTDKYWWQLIHDWIINIDHAMLVIFWWDPLCVKSSVGSCLSAKKRFEKILWKKLDISSSQVDLVRSKVHTVFSSNPFNF